MISSLIHVLIVTPVIFFWLRERRLKQEVPPSNSEPGHITERGAEEKVGVEEKEMADVLQLRGTREA
jgi:hypothetical protein